MSTPRYPDLTVRLRSANPLALIAAVRLALRRAGVEPEEIRRFSSQALSAEQEADRVDVCRRWAHIEIQPAAAERTF